MKLRIYTDGGARGNPGPAAAGVMIKQVEDGQETQIATISEYLGETTNNQAEYKAIVFGLEKALELQADEVEVVMDTELAYKQLIGEYRVKHPEIAKRFLEVHNIKQKLPKVSFRHVRREKNKEADALVNQALDKYLKTKKKD